MSGLRFIWTRWWFSEILISLKLISLIFTHQIETHEWCIKVHFRFKKIRWNKSWEQKNIFPNFFLICITIWNSYVCYAENIINWIIIINFRGIDDGEKSSHKIIPSIPSGSNKRNTRHFSSSDAKTKAIERESISQHKSLPSKLKSSRKASSWTSKMFSSVWVNSDFQVKKKTFD